MISHNKILWLCLSALLYSAITLWTIHNDIPTALSLNEWQQPLDNSAPHAEPISAQQWDFNYQDTEKILAHAALSGSPPNKGKPQLLFNSDLANVLSRAVNSMPRNMSHKALQRTEFLVSKGLPGLPGKQLASVLINYYEFKQAVNISHPPQDNPVKSTHNLSKKYSNFLAKERLQNEYLGSQVANQLFSKQREITHYLYKSIAIKKNSSLSQQQKKRQLNKLKNEIKHNIKTDVNLGIDNG